jgi:tRNA dimethylallyltransferase
MQDRAPDAVLIAGPTASGKSAVALHVAETCNGIVINADSMQVYDEMRVLTARPTPADEARVSHCLYGHVPAREAYSVARWLEDAAGALAEARHAGRLPVIVGGTGLYFKALLEGLSPIPAIPGSIRAHWREEAARRGAPALYELLRERDPETAARLHPTDTQRLLRALEVLEATGRPLAEWQALPGAPLMSRERTVRLVLAAEREDLYRRCDARFEAMIAGGGLEEAARMRALGLAPTLPAMRTIGLRALMAVVAGEMPLDLARQQAQMETRRYVKRQMTWIRKNMISWKLISTKQMERTKDEISLIIMRALDRPIPWA